MQIFPRSSAALLVLLLTCACVAPDPPLRSGAAFPRLLLVGIDGATFDRIHPLVNDGRLPHLGSMIDAGCAVPLETLEPTVSPAIWTTIATGKPPSEHGILGFEGVPGQTMRTLPTSSMRRTRAFWTILDEQGRSVGIVGWWATWPAEPVNGWIVSDRTMYTRMEATIGDEAIRAGEVHPAELAEFVRRYVRRPDALTAEELRRFIDAPAAELERNSGVDYSHGRLIPELRYVYQSDRSTVDLAEALLADRPVDVAAVGLYGVDTVSHLAWHFAEPDEFPQLRVAPELVERFGGVIDRYYEAVDEWVGRLVGAVGDDAIVIVFSDHGFGPTGNVPWSGGHGRITPGAPVAPDGVLIVSGAGVRADCTLERAHVFDLTPTILALQGLAAAEDMPGRVLHALFAEGTMPRTDRVATYETTPLERPADLPEGDPLLDRESLERLRNLGYID